MDTTYDAAYMRAFYDDYGEREWERLENDGHPMHLYRSEELRSLLQRHACTVAAMSAANFLSPGHERTLAETLGDAAMWNAVLDAEVEACAQPGVLDGGTHIIAVVQRD